MDFKENIKFSTDYRSSGFNQDKGTSYVIVSIESQARSRLIQLRCHFQMLRAHKQSVHSVCITPSKRMNRLKRIRLCDDLTDRSFHFNGDTA